MGRRRCATRRSPAGTGRTCWPRTGCKAGAGVFGEHAAVVAGAEALVAVDVDERAQGGHGASELQHGEHHAHVVLDERHRVGDGAVHVGAGGVVDDVVGLAERGGHVRRQRLGQVAGHHGDPAGVFPGAGAFDPGHVALVVEADGQRDVPAGVHQQVPQGVAAGEAGASGENRASHRTASGQGPGG